MGERAESRLEGVNRKELSVSSKKAVFVRHRFLGRENLRCF